MDGSPHLRLLTDEDAITGIETVQCDGSMTCRCDGCCAERARRVRRGVQPVKGSPFVRRPVRRAA